MSISQKNLDKFVVQAMRYHNAGQYADAEQVYRKILTIKPDWAELLNNLTIVLRAQGKFEAAAIFCQRAITLNPKYAEAHSNLGNVLKDQGKLSEAAQCYERALGLKPDYPDALFNLAATLREQGRREDAITRFTQALRLKPEHPEALHTLATLLKEHGRLDDAISYYRQALHLKPAFPEAHYNLADAFHSQDRLDEAIAHYTQAVRLKPDFLEAHYNLGNARQKQGQLEAAIVHYSAALELKPDFPAVLYNLGLALQAQGKLDQAIARYTEALGVQPDFPVALYNLGNALKERGELEAALSRYTEALAFKPDFPEALCNLGTVLKEQGFLDQAIVRYREALALKPDFPDALCNLGLAHKECGDPDQALAWYAKALALNPDFPEAHWNESLARLLIGDFATGWRKYEWRWRKKDSKPHGLPYPLWEGGRLEGRTILLHCEQGFGDSLHFVRYGKLVKAMGGRVILLCPVPLARLFRTAAGLDLLVTTTAELPPCDCQAPLLSLPWLLGTTLATIPADIPYLEPEPALVEAWRQRLTALEGVKVGLVWAGDPRRHMPKANAIDRRRSMRLDQFAPLAEVPGVRFLSLQKGEPADQARQPPSGLDLVDWTGELHDFADTAALIANLDLIITVDTSIVHLAGALGRPVWMLSRFDGCWRWLRDRDDSPWYPTLRIFRQSRAGDWEPVIERVVAELRTWVDNNPSQTVSFYQRALETMVEEFQNAFPPTLKLTLKIGIEVLYQRAE